MRIQAMILSQFNDKKGFAIIQVVPKEGIITQKQFSVYSQLILHRQQLCGKLLVVQFMEKYYLVGIPLMSVNSEENGVYTRARFIYSVNILIPKKSYLDEKLQPMYKQIAKKLGHFFKFIQETSHIIYNHTNYQKYISRTLERCFKDVNSPNQCVLTHLSSCFTILSFNSPFDYTRAVIPANLQGGSNSSDRRQTLTKYSVPITFLTEDQIEEGIQDKICKQFMHFARLGDYTLKKIIQKMDGEKMVYKYYRKAIQMGLVAVADIFCLYNHYYLTDKIHQYIIENNDHQVLKKICKAVTKSQSKSDNQVRPFDLLKLYVQFHRKVSLKKIIDDNLQFIVKINFVKFIRISYILGIIKRIQQRLAFIQQKRSDPFEFIQEDNLNLLKQMEFTNDLIQEKQRYNTELTNHIKKMSSIQQICLDLELDRGKLFKIIKKHGQGNVRIFYTLQ